MRLSSFVRKGRFRILVHSLRASPAPPLAAVYCTKAGCPQNADYFFPPPDLSESVRRTLFLLTYNIQTSTTKKSELAIFSLSAFTIQPASPRHRCTRSQRRSDIWNFSAETSAYHTMASKRDWPDLRPQNSRNLPDDPTAHYVKTGYINDKDKIELLQRSNEVEFESSEAGKSEGYRAPFYTNIIIAPPPAPERTIAEISDDLIKRLTQYNGTSDTEKAQRERTKAIVILDDDDVPPPRAPTPRQHNVLAPPRPSLFQNGHQLDGGATRFGNRVLLPPTPHHQHGSVSSSGAGLPKAHNGLQQQVTPPDMRHGSLPLVQSTPYQHQNISPPGLGLQKASNGVQPLGLPSNVVYTSARRPRTPHQQGTPAAGTGLRRAQNGPQLLSPPSTGENNSLKRKNDTSAQTGGPQKKSRPTPSSADVATQWSTKRATPAQDHDLASLFSNDRLPNDQNTPVGPRPSPHMPYNQSPMLPQGYGQALPQGHGQSVHGMPRFMPGQQQANMVGPPPQVFRQNTPGMPHPAQAQRINGQGALPQSYRQNAPSMSQTNPYLRNTMPANPLQNPYLMAPGMNSVAHDQKPKVLATPPQIFTQNPHGMYSNAPGQRSNMPGTNLHQMHGWSAPIMHNTVPNQTPNMPMNPQQGIHQSAPVMPYAIPVQQASRLAPPFQDNRQNATGMPLGVLGQQPNARAALPQSHVQQQHQLPSAEAVQNKMSAQKAKLAARHLTQYTATVAKYGTNPSAMPNHPLQQLALQHENEKRRLITNLKDMGARWRHAMMQRHAQGPTQ